MSGRRSDHAHRYGALRLYVNFFQPSFKLIDKTRDGGTIAKRYSPPTLYLLPVSPFSIQ